MRIAIIGQAAFGQAVFARLTGEGEEIVGISAPAPNGDRADLLWAAAAETGCPAIPTVDLKTEEGLARWQALRPDICVMAFVTEILPEAVFAVPTRGTIQYHPSLLPLHRGSSAINWAIINQDAETGVTIFWPDEGVDTGPVLLQKRVAIGPDDTVGGLYFDHLFPLGVEALSESVAMIKGGTVTAVAQDHAAATDEPPCRDEHAEIAWHAPADRVYALIRGCNPQPGAWTTVADRKLRIFDSRLSHDAEPGDAGRILRVADDGIDVRLNGGVLRVIRVQPAGEKKMPAAEWAAREGIAAGMRLR